MSKCLKVALILLLSLPVYAGEKREMYEKVEFRGVKYLSKLDFATPDIVKAVNGRLSVDREKLEEALDKETLIKNYKLIDKNKTLVIIVEEKVPFYLIGCYKNDILHFYELDSDYELVSRGAHLKDVPVIMVQPSDFSGKEAGERLKGYLKELGQFTGSALWHEMAMIDLRSEVVGDGEILVTLRGRKTRFYLQPGVSGFSRLNSICGYLDGAGYYPDSLHLSQNYVVLD